MSVCSVSRRGTVEQQLRRVCVEPERVAPAGGGCGGGGGGGGTAARAHAVRLPGGERGRAVLRAEPDHHQRVPVRRARLAARLAQRQARARARQLRGAAAVVPPPPRPHAPTPPRPSSHTKYHIVVLRC